MAPSEKKASEANRDGISAYFQDLLPVAKLRYTEKLQYDRRTRDLPDPYALQGGWCDDPSLWPDLTFGDVYTYLIDTPGIYTRSALKAHKSLLAYQ
jgi:hypothetical protein